MDRAKQRYGLTQIPLIGVTADVQGGAMTARWTFYMARYGDMRRNAGPEKAKAPRGFISQSRAFFENRYLERETLEPAQHVF